MGQKMTTSTEADTSGADQETKRTAVIFVHGQGEQSPMKDVHELVNAVWTNKNSGLNKIDQRDFDDEAYLQDIETENNSVEFDNSSTWNIPNFRSDLHDIRRLTTDKTRDGQRFSFYEFYWADLMTGNRLSHVTNWLAICINISSESTPDHLKPLRHLVYALAYIFGFWVLSFAIFSSLTMIGFLVESLPLWLGKTLETLWLILACLVTASLILMSIQVSSKSIKSAPKEASSKTAINILKSDKKVFSIFKTSSVIIAQPIAYILNAVTITVRLLMAQLKWLSPIIGFFVLSFFAIKLSGVFKASLAILLLISTVMFFAVFFSRKLTDLISRSWQILLLVGVCVLVYSLQDGGLKLPDLRVSENLPINIDRKFICFWCVGLYALLGLHVIKEITVFSFFGEILQKNHHTIINTTLLLLSAAITIGFKDHINSNDPGLFFRQCFEISVLAFSVIILGIAYLLYLSRNFILDVMADSARYFSKSPENVARRSAIIRRGVKCFTQLVRKNLIV